MPLLVHPDRLHAAKASLVIALLAIPAVVLGYSFFAVTLALGALAGALSETDDHPSGRIKSSLLKVVSFAVSSLAVEMLHHYPIVLGIGLALSTVFFIIVGGISERYRGVTFGALLVGIYTMLGSDISPAWYWQPLLLTAGALFYGIISLLILYLWPWRLLEEQLARGYTALAAYFNEKSRLFPSDKEVQTEIRNRLALLNIETVGALDRCKEVLNSYADALKDQSPLVPYFHYFMVLQSLHERAASSHDKYEALSERREHTDLLEGIGQTMHQLSEASKLFANSLLSKTAYKHPVALQWMIQTINQQLNSGSNGKHQALELLVLNLTRSNEALKNITTQSAYLMMPRLERDERSIIKRIKDQLSTKHPRFRYAIRLSLSFLIGFFISEWFQIEKGEWIILTILFVLQPNYSATRRRFSQRVLGTLSGVFAGVAIVQLLTFAGQLLLMLIAAYFFFLWMKRRYALSVVFVTIFVLCAFNLIANKGVAVMLPRMFDTLIGAVLAFASVRLLWPDWQGKKLPQLLTLALNKNHLYFEAILKEYSRKDHSDNFEYRLARREAHRADNELAAAWQNMQLEPASQRQFRKQAFRLTYLNHALLSYLSALGVHRETQSTAVDNFGTISKQILAALNTASQAIGTGKKAGFASHELLNEIREKLKTETTGDGRQQYILLFNLAEVTGQLIDETGYFNAAATKGKPDQQSSES